MATSEFAGFLGRWWITAMEQWDEEYRDLMVPAFIEFSRAGQGGFQFGTVRGWMDCRTGQRDDLPAVEFFWDGQSDDDSGSGRGWAILQDGRLRGRLSFTAATTRRSRPSGNP